MALNLEHGAQKMRKTKYDLIRDIQEACKIEHQLAARFDRSKKAEDYDALLEAKNNRAYIINYALDRLVLSKAPKGETVPF